MRIFFWKKEEKEPESLGAGGEKIAENFLREKGYRIIARNFKNPYGRRLGEIDIIAEDGKEIVFVEVKTRTITSPSDPLPEENINRDKLHRLQKIANFYIRKNKLWDRLHRFDAISLAFMENAEDPVIRHLKSIFI